MLVVRDRRHHVDPVPDLVETVGPVPPPFAEDFLSQARLEDHQLHELGPFGKFGPCPRGAVAGMGPSCHPICCDQASKSSTTLPPSTISIGRLPGAISSLSATMP